MKFYGQFDPPVDKVLYDRYFKNNFNCTSIECGAFDGLTECCTKFFEENFNWKTINIEPLPNAFEKLIINRPNSINVNVALSDTNDDKLFTNYKHPVLGYDWGNGSLQHTIEHENELNQFCNENTKFMVKCLTYEQLIKIYEIEKLDLFVLDVEGHEDKVIDGMILSNVFPEIFVIEHGHKSTEIIENKLKCLPVEYKLDYVSHVNSFFIKINSNN
jgi:FkbM family methyltransferase